MLTIGDVLVQLFPTIFTIAMVGLPFYLLFAMNNRLLGKPTPPPKSRILPRKKPPIETPVDNKEVPVSLKDSQNRKRFK